MGKKTTEKPEASNLPAVRGAPSFPMTLAKVQEMDRDGLNQAYMALVKHEAAYLGDRQAFIRRDGAGNIVAVKGKITLSKQNGQVYAVKTKERGPDGNDVWTTRWNRTFQGLVMCNSIPGVSCGMPEAARSSIQ